MDNQTKSQIKDAKLRCSINSHWCIVWCIVWEYEMSRYYLNENNTCRLIYALGIISYKNKS